MPLTLGKKLALSTGSILSIALGLGSYAALQMHSASHQSDDLREHTIPAVIAANAIERNWQDTMFALRGYTFTHDEHFLQAGLFSLQETYIELENGLHVADLDHSDTIKSLFIQAKKAVAEYQKLTTEIVKTTAALAADDSVLTSASEQFIAISKDISNNLQQRLEAEVAADLDHDRITESIARSAASSRIHSNGQEIRLVTRNAIALRSPGQFKAVEPLLQAIREDISRIRPALRLPADLKRLDTLATATHAYAKSLESFQRHFAEHTALVEKSLATSATILKAAQDAAAAAAHSMAAASAESSQNLSRTRSQLWFGLLLTSLVGGLLTVLLTRSITRPIHRCVSAIQQLAGGHLNDHIGLKRSDEIGELAASIDTCTDNLRKLTEERAATAEQTRKSLELAAQRLEGLVESRTAALTVSEARFRALFETMAQGMVTQDVEGRIESANAAAEKSWGSTSPNFRAVAQRTPAGMSPMPQALPWRPINTPPAWRKAPVCPCATPSCRCSIRCSTSSAGSWWIACRSSPRAIRCRCAPTPRLPTSMTACSPSARCRSARRSLRAFSSSRWTCSASPMRGGISCGPTPRGRSRSATAARS